MDDLVRGAQRGDPLAMDALVRALAPRVGRLCGSIALQHGDDALQETLIAVLRHIGALRDPAALWGWVRRIAVHESVRVAQRASRVVPVEDVEQTGTSDIESSVDVRAVLADLPVDQRAILVLRDLEGMSEEEAARLLDAPVGTVKSRLHRARAAFRERWVS